MREQLDSRCPEENARAAGSTMPRERMHEQLDPQCLGRECASSWIHNALEERMREQLDPQCLAGERMPKQLDP